MPKIINFSYQDLMDISLILWLISICLIIKIISLDIQMNIPKPW